MAAASSGQRYSVRWRYEQVSWGDTECQRKRCSRPAELLYDALPLCVECADDLLDRQGAVFSNPALATLLPDWGDS